MNKHQNPRHRLAYWWIACAVFSLLISACQPVSGAADILSEQPTTTVMVEPMPTATQPLAASYAGIILDFYGVAQDFSIETVAAVPARADGPWWEAKPNHRLVTLQGYPVTNHLLQPQIFVYPVADLAGYNETAGQIATDLQALLQTRQAGNSMPYLPLYNAAQVMHSQVQYLDFKNGTGVRFLTQFDQGILPVNSYELVYTYQGLTSDGKYYVAAVLPVTHPELPTTAQVFPQDSEEMKDFPAYMANTVAWLDQQPASSFTPDLAKLDALMQSLDVNQP